MGNGDGNQAGKGAGQAQQPVGGGGAGKMTQDAAGRIQAAEAKAGDGGVSKGGFAGRAQAAAAHNAGKARPYTLRAVPDCCKPCGQMSQAFLSQCHDKHADEGVSNLYNHVTVFLCVCIMHMHNLGEVGECIFI